VRDLAILVPSRGRPASVTRLVQACAAMSTLDYQLCFAFDHDDPELADGVAAAKRGSRSYLWQGPRQGLAAWTNTMWRDLEGEFRLFASIGDDHEPLTRGWDEQMSQVLDDRGGGFAYCDNGHPDPNWPEMCVISAPILSALGWMAEPSMLHYCIDVVWRDLGEAADCLYYLPGVVLEHHHWAFGGPRAGARDDTYWEAAERGRDDVRAHAKWETERKAGDVAKVKAALAALAEEPADVPR
jgi:hypothetical protein